MAGSRCDNSYSPHSGFSVEERILELIDESEIESTNNYREKRNGQDARVQRHMRTASSPSFSVSNLLL
jgi:hypothetical protein